MQQPFTPNNNFPDSGILGKLAPLMPIWALSSQAEWFQTTLALSLRQITEKLAELKPLYHSFCEWTWQENPLHPLFIRLQSEGLGQSARPDAKLLSVISGPELDSQDLNLWQDVRHCQDEALISEFLGTVYQARGASARWLGQSFAELQNLPVANGLELLEIFVKSGGERVLADRLAAELAWRWIPPRDRLPYLAKVDERVFGVWKTRAMAECFAELGQAGQAIALLSDLWRNFPWHLNLTLRLYDLCNPLNLRPELLQAGDTAVFIYTWNKAGLLRECLSALAGSELGRCQVLALDNGSSDATAGVLREFGGAFGEGRFASLSLPVNVGAPAARNWLLNLPETAGLPFKAFLDDDAYVPGDWLVRLRSLAEDNPWAGALGCAITDAESPHRMQVADCHLLPKALGEAGLEDIDEKIFIFNSCAGLAAWEGFAYTRTCLSVSGCCHLLRQTALDKAGWFDVSFNPSQFDDLERDMRSALAGYPALYHGQLRIRHAQNSSLRQADSLAKATHVAGNKMKLEFKYSQDQISKLFSQDYAAMWKDFECKSAWLAQRFGGVETSV